ncbi:MAG: SagB/ThcOx family dehydrogenase, partial [Candidatus Aminicenantes bacterium]|nr:SagB/ThcOx family dehydrogenase [Candidatus Aminicenantes bacterium]
MKRRTFVKNTIAALPAVAALSLPGAGTTADMQPIGLPTPGKEWGETLQAALRNRKTIRDIGPQELPLQVLSDLLWAA